MTLNLIFDQTLTRTTGSAGIHRLRVPRIDRGVLSRVIDQLGLAKQRGGFTWERANSWVIAQDARIVVAMNELSGGLRYRLRPMEEEPGSDIATTPARLEEIARAFIGDLGRPGEPLTLDRITYLRGQTTTKEGVPLTSFALDAGLVFTRTIDELPVIGAGGIAMIKIGTDESVVGGREIWRAIDSKGPAVRLRSADEAVSILKARLVAAGLDGDVHVRKSALGYGELGIGELQTTLVPIYAFLVETSGGLVDSKRVEMVPAPVDGPMIIA